MQGRDYPVEKVNTVANYAILSQADNAELADRDPFDVWRSLKPNQRDCASAQLFFTANENLFTAYEEFIEFRAEKLAEKLNDFVGLGERRSGGVESRLNRGTRFLTPEALRQAAPCNARIFFLTPDGKSTNTKWFLWYG